MEDSSEEIELPTGNPFISSGSSALAGVTGFFSNKLVPGLKSAGSSIATAAKERDFSKLKGFGSKVVYFVRRATFTTLTILSDISSGSADFFASLAKRVNPGEHVPQLADRFSSKAPAPPPAVDSGSDAPDTIVDP